MKLGAACATTIILFSAMAVAAEPLGQIYYVNGVCSSRSDARNSARLLKQSLSEEFGSDEFAGLYPTSNLYNFSDGCLLDLYEAAIQVVEDEGLSNASWIWRTFFNLPSQIGADLLPSLDTIFESVVSGHLDVTEHDLETLLAELAGSLDESPVALVAHSQGNLFANTLYDRSSLCRLPSLGLVSVATPASRVGGGGPHWTSTSDFIWRVPGALGPNTLAGECFFTWQCHAFENYLEVGAQSRDDILGDVFLALASLPDPPIGGCSEGVPVWVQEAPANSPSLRAEHAMVFDSARGVTVLFGGALEVGCSDETWIWNSEEWFQSTPTVKPPEDCFVPMAYDSVRAEVVLLNRSSETWVWNGSDWARRFSTVNPPTPIDQAMAFDEVRGEVVFFGGLVGNQTWTWNGDEWTQKFPVNSPSARVGHAMVYDSERQEIMLFGGSEINGVPVNDTWVWDGVDWTEKHPSVSPLPRLQHAMVYDSVGMRTVLFGGVVGGGAIDDVWFWDGSMWVQQLDFTRPPARHQHSMAYDSAQNEVVLFGGFGFWLLGDTWTFGAPD